MTPPNQTYKLAIYKKYLLYKAYYYTFIYNKNGLNRLMQNVPICTICTLGFNCHFVSPYTNILFLSFIGLQRLNLLDAPVSLALIKFIFICYVSRSLGKTQNKMATSGEICGCIAPSKLV